MSPGSLLDTALRSSARELLQKKLDAAKDDPDSVSLTAAARATEVVEKVYSHSDEGSVKEDSRSFADRLRWVVALGDEMRRRGMEPVVEQPVPIDTVVIDAEPDPGSSED